MCSLLSIEFSYVGVVSGGAVLYIECVLLGLGGEWRRSLNHRLAAFCDDSHAEVSTGGVGGD